MLLFFVFAAPAQQEVKDSLLQVLSNQRADSFKVQTYKQLWRATISANLDTALVYADQGLELAQRISYPRGIADHSVYKAYVQDKKGESPEAIATLKAALYQLENAFDFYNGEVFVIEWLANIYRDSNEVDSARVYYTKLAERAIGNNVNHQIAAHQGLGSFYQAENLYKPALYHFQIADSICRVRAVDNNICTSCTSNIGIILSEIRDFEKANEYFELAEQEYRSRNEEILIQELNLYRADMAYRQKDIDLVETYAQRARDYFAKDSSIVNWEKALRELTWVEIHREEHSNAEALCLQRLELLEANQDSLRMGYAFADLGTIYLRLDDDEKSQEYLNIARAIANQKEDTDLNQLCLKFLVDVLVKTENWQGALEATQEWSETLQKINRDNDTRMVKEMEITYDTRNKEREIQLLATQNQLIQQQQKAQKRTLLFVVGALSILLVLLYYLFQLKQRTNTKLKEVDVLKSQFFANISHEFRTPLSLIQGPLEQEMERNDLDDEQARRFHIMHRNTNRLRRLVNDLLELSQLQAGQRQLKVQPVHVSNHFKTIFANFQSKAMAKKQQYTYSVNVNSEIGYYDPDVIESITYNLLSNAFKYTPSAGSIKARVDEVNAGIRIEIQDTGMGLTNKEQAQIFERFYRIDNSDTASAEGAGIGLALVKELVKTQLGSIELQSELQKGSTFIVDLPINKSNYASQQIATEVLHLNRDNTFSASEHSMYSETEQDAHVLLIVEDNADLRAHIASLFKEKFTIIQAPNGQIGLEKAILRIPNMIITDMMMPEMDGQALANALKDDERTSHIPVLMLTAKAEQNDKLRALQIGIDDYITKPFNNQELVIRVQNLVQQREKLRQKYSSDAILDAKKVTLSSTDERFWQKVETVLKQQLTESDFNVERFGKHLNMSRMQLHRKLKALTGLSTSAFIRKQRLKLAVSLIRERNTDISEVAYAVGFNNSAYFSRLFKEEFGSSPSEFRHQIHQ